MRLVYGIGDAKLREFGERFLHAIAEHSRLQGLELDQAAGPLRPPEPPKTSARPNPQLDLAFQLFRRRASLAEVIQQTNRSRGTVSEYLCEFIREERPASIAAWVNPALYEQIAAAARQTGLERLKPIFLALGENVSYDDIRLVVTHLQAAGTPS
jgi:ATP-dependent DNA helicase RecQ